MILVDGVTVNSLNDIPSDQVESIDVLKDASSTAIYGARGANGVIPVSYTHLDVYKRQHSWWGLTLPICKI